MLPESLGHKISPSS